MWENKKISFVIPCYHSEKTLAGVVKEIDGTMEGLPSYTHEIVMVNDGSGKETWEVIRALCKEKQNRFGMDLARNFGQHAALMAGIRHTTGDIVVCLDDDGQTPADEAGKLLHAIREGADVAYASYDHKEHSAFRNFGSWVNEKMLEKMLNKPHDLYVSSYFAMRRFVADEVLRYQNSYPYLLGLVLRTTKNIVNVPVHHRKREVGRSGYTFGKLLALWMNGFTAFSIKPLRIGAFLCLCHLYHWEKTGESSRSGRILCPDDGHHFFRRHDNADAGTCRRVHRENLYFCQQCAAVCDTGRDRKGRAVNAESGNTEEKCGVRRTFDRPGDCPCHHLANAAVSGRAHICFRS